MFKFILAGNPFRCSTCSDLNAVGERRIIRCSPCLVQTADEDSEI